MAIIIKDGKQPRGLHTPFSRRSILASLPLALLFRNKIFALGKNAAATSQDSLTKAKLLPLNSVRLTGGPLKNAQDLDGKYLLSLEPDRMLAYLRQRAGLEQKAQPYGGWDGAGRQLTGHIAGHHLSGVSLMYAATGDARFKDRADYIVKELQVIQDKQGDGYIGGLTDNQGVDGKVLFNNLSNGVIKSSSFDLNGMWSPWYVQHKIFAGLRDAYRHTGNQTALDVEVKFAGWAERVLSKLNDDQIQQMLGTEFGGMNEVTADLYADTGDKRWLALSDKFEQRAMIDPLAAGTDNLEHKHGNMNVPKLYGSLARYIYTGNHTDGDAARFFWTAVVYHHTFATGGHGKNEYFGGPDKLNEIVDGRTDETCDVYNMLKMTRTFFSIDPDIRYAEYHERALFNHILASQDPSDGRVCYMVPVGRGVQHEYQDMLRDFTCCVGSSMESHALHGHGIYFENGDKLWVNIYAPSTADWQYAGVKLEMNTDFPAGQTASLKVTPNSPKKLTLALRRPSWAGAGFGVKINGQELKNVPAAGSYVEIDRTWKKGDTVDLVMPMTLSSEPLKDNPNRMALLWGPLVLAGDLGPEESRRGRGQGFNGGPPTAPPPPPVFVTSAGSVDGWLKPVAGRPGTFRTEGVGLTTYVDFTPFYQLPDRRYAIYWDVFTPEAWKKETEALAAEQEKQKALEAATVAFVQPGQTQSEHDFNQQGEDTAAIPQGGRGGQMRAGRRGTKWFSFDLPVDSAHPMSVLVTYNNNENRRGTFNILVDGTKVGEHATDRHSPEEEIRFFDVPYAIPPSLVQGKQKVTVRFEAGDGGVISAVYGIRMVRADAIHQ
jgi:DUF1680 family protein